MSNNTFYTIASAMLREGKNCKHEADRKCIPVETDKACRLCIMEKFRLARDAK